MPDDGASLRGEMSHDEPPSSVLLDPVEPLHVGDLSSGSGTPSGSALLLRALHFPKKRSIL